MQGEASFLQQNPPGSSNRSPPLRARFSPCPPLAHYRMRVREQDGRRAYLHFTAEDEPVDRSKFRNHALSSIAADRPALHGIKKPRQVTARLTARRRHVFN